MDHHELQEVALREHGDYIIKRLNNYSISYEIKHNQLNFIFESQDLINFVTFLYEDTHCHYNQLTDLFCIDNPGIPKRFSLVYQFLSLKTHRRINIICKCEDSFLSLGEIFPAAYLYERAVWDLFGIQFKNHLDHRRLFNPAFFSYFPLRKDYPEEGIRSPFITEEII